MILAGRVGANSNSHRVATTLLYGGDCIYWAK